MSKTFQKYFDEFEENELNQHKYCDHETLNHMEDAGYNYPQDWEE